MPTPARDSPPALKLAFGCVLTALLTGGGMYATQSIRVEANASAIARNATQIDRTGGQLERLMTAQTALLIEQRLLIQRVDRLLEQDDAR